MKKVAGLGVIFLAGLLLMPGSAWPARCSRTVLPHHFPRPKS